jgi:hypothetical protein
MLVSIRPGAVSGIRRPGPLPPAVPCGLLVGAEVVAGFGTSHALDAPAAAVRIVGGACWCRLTQGAELPVVLLGRVLDHFGRPA